MRKLGECVKYKIGNLEGEGIVVGKSTIEFPIIGAFYILEDISGNMPSDTYYYTHFTCPEAWLSDIEEN